MTHFGDVELFLSSHNGIVPATMTKLVSVLSTKKDKLMVELAAVIGAGESLVKSTYNLEGDWPLALQYIAMNR